MITITEALAELKTLDKRIEKKREFVVQHLVRQQRFQDPLRKEGGQEEVVRRERQAMVDLQERKIRLRRAIQQANEGATITVDGTTRTIADWLVWRREVAPEYTNLLEQVTRTIAVARNDAARKGLAVVSSADLATSDNDLVVNIDEVALAGETERLQATLGTLDGQLSLKNATIGIEV